MSDSKDNMIVFCRIGWMKEYKGLEGDSISGGGVWVDEHGYGHEILNFKKLNNVVCGFVEPPSFKDKGSINLDRIAKGAAGDQLANVTVVWFSYRRGTGQVIIGWYSNAVVYRTWHRRSIEHGESRTDNFDGDSYGGIDYYFFETNIIHATLLPIGNRRFQVPRQKYFSGQSNVWYADSDEPEVKKYVQEVYDYIENYKDGYEPNTGYFVKGKLPAIQETNKGINSNVLKKISDLENLLKDDPDNSETLKKMAGLLIDEGYSNKAIEYIDKALKLNDSDWELHYWLAICEENKGNYKRSIEIMETAIPLAFNDSDKAEITNNIGCMHDNLGDFELALGNFEQAAKLVDSEDLYHHNKGQILYRLERYEESIACLLKACEMNENDEETLNWLGVVYEEIHDYPNAINYYNLAVSCKTNETYALENLAKLYENLGLFSKARETWRFYKRGDRLLKKAEKALNRLRNKPDKPTITIKNVQEQVNRSPKPEVPQIEKSHDISKEKYLEEEICRLINCGLIFNGELEIYEEAGMPYGQQFSTDVGRIDLLCRNKNNDSLVVIEIKKGKSADQVIGQISRYMGYIKKRIAKPEQSIEGIIVTYGSDKKLEYAVSIHDKIRVFTYSVNITEWQDEE